MAIDSSDVPLPPYDETIGIEITGVDSGYEMGCLPLPEASSVSSAMVPRNGVNVGIVGFETDDDTVAVARESGNLRGGTGDSPWDVSER